MRIADSGRFPHPDRRRPGAARTDSNTQRAHTSGGRVPLERMRLGARWRMCTLCGCTAAALRNVSFAWSEEDRFDADRRRLVGGLAKLRQAHLWRNLGRGHKGWEEDHDGFGRLLSLFLGGLANVFVLGDWGEARWAVTSTEHKHRPADDGVLVHLVCVARANLRIDFRPVGPVGEIIEGVRFAQDFEVLNCFRPALLAESLGECIEARTGFPGQLCSRRLLARIYLLE
mmetsp:Transcript_18447/g.47298  ORF Transcript_18447/g.47298 Transcript_18447/m.47298 type:complete len:229 (-) Transcript_18447:524-1210(-)